MDATVAHNNQILFQEITTFFDGEFDNFQQAWQENTEEDIHRTEAKEKHQHFHLTSEKQFSEFNKHFNTTFILKNYKGRNNPKLLNTFSLTLIYLGETDTIISSFSELPFNQKTKNEEKDTEKILWSKSGTTLEGKSDTGNTHIKIIGNQLIINQKNGVFKNPLPYKMIKCRFFSGFIEVPNPENPDKMIRMGDLKLHDQGDMVQFAYEDGTKGKFIVELTQLIFAKRLAIMKLGVYDEPIEDIHYSSRAMSYTWTNPEAKRIGINLRKMLTGWTYIEPGFISSNNMDLEEK